MNYFRAVTASTVAIISLPATAFAQQIPSFFPGNHMMGSGMGWFMGPFMMLLFLGLAVGVIALVIRWVFGINRRSAGSSSAMSEITPLDILKERYAKGEIDKKEFDDRKKTLTQS